MREIKSTWLKRLTVPATFCKVAPNQNTYLELVSAVPSIDDNGRESVNVRGQAAGAKFGYAGYINKNHSNGVYDILKNAQENQNVVLMRFERQRKEGSDPNKTIEEVTTDMNVARDNVYKVLTAIYDFQNEKWIQANNTISDVNNDPPEVQEWIQKWVISEETTPDEFFASPTPDKPKFMPKDSAYDREQQLLNVYYFIMSQEKELGISFKDSFRQRLSVVLLNTADRIQLKLTGMDEPNYRDYSHTRARHVMFSLIQYKHPISEELLEKGSLKSWVVNITKDAFDTIEWLESTREDDIEE